MRLFALGVVVVVIIITLSGCALKGGLSALVLTCGDFRAVQPSMTYAEVVETIGDAHASLLASNANSAIYQWRSGRGVMDVTFYRENPSTPSEQAIVTTTAQYGLC